MRVGAKVDGAFEGDDDGICEGDKDGPEDGNPLG